MENQTRQSQHTKDLVLASLLLALAVVAQLVGRNFPGVSRLFVGPIVNAVLLLTTAMTSLALAIPVAILTPILAYAVGQLNPMLAPMIPFIIVSNVIYVIVFSFAKEQRWQRILFAILASIAKYLFFLLTTNFLLDVFKISFPEKIQNNLPVAFGTTQLIAALIGAAIALICLEILPKKWRKSVATSEYKDIAEERKQ